MFLQSFVREMISVVSAVSVGSISGAPTWLRKRWLVGDCWRWLIRGSDFGFGLIKGDKEIEVRLEGG